MECKRYERAGGKLAYENDEQSESSCDIESSLEAEASVNFKVTQFVAAINSGCRPTHRLAVSLNSCCLFMRLSD